MPSDRACPGTPRRRAHGAPPPSPAPVARGHSNAEIASRLFVSLDAVKTTLKETRAALGAKAGANAIALGFVHGFITDADVVR